MGPEWKTAVNQFGDGTVERVSKWTSDRMKWTLKYRVNATDRNTLVNFFNARKGRGESFSFTDFKTSTSYTAAFVDDEFSMSSVVGTAWWEGVVNIEETNS